METLSFTFGVLSVVAVIILTVIVMGIVKVLKQQNPNTKYKRSHAPCRK